MLDSFIRTDQTDCYDAQGNVIHCLKSPQDGNVKTGKAWPEPRFLDHGDTVEDHLSGIIWTKNASLTEFPLSWREALSFVNEMNKSKRFDYNKWILPTRKQLFSLISHVKINPALPKGHPFKDVFNGYYWTSTEVARYPSQAWYVHLGGGRIFKGMKHVSYMVWPAIEHVKDKDQRLGSADDLPELKDRFVDKGGTVFDRYTGLEWTKDANYIAEPSTWITSLETVDKMNMENVFGYSNWRLPNIRELESLVDTESHSPALTPGAPFDNVQKYYWSSTTSTFEPTYAWVLYIADGAVGVGFKKSNEFFGWPVRTAY